MSFYTDTIRLSPLFHSTKPVSDLNLLEPTFRRKVLAVISDAHGHGQEFRVLETYRSQELQAIYFKRGVTKLRNVGVHHFALACDLVRVVNGRDDWNADFSLLAKLAKSHSIVSGLNWNQPGPNRFVDAGHLQRINVSDQGKLFRGEWYPDESYDPYA
jgi:hypothetical protein